jgi:hypothetical protein
MNFLLGIVITALFMILLVSIVNETVESFRGRRGVRGDRGWRRGSWRRRRTNPNRYLRRFRRRNNWWGYRDWYGSGIRDYGWWPGYLTLGSLAGPCNCKRGCTPDGCAYPGNGPDDCVWATDCNCCGW